MELLVVTLAHTNPRQETDIQARIRSIADTLRNAPGIISSQFYRSRKDTSYYLILTTWDSEEAWNKGKERYNPRYLLLSSAPSLLTADPEQWLMHYLWGYSRPAATAALAAMHLVQVSPGQREAVQKAWIEGLRKQAIHPVLAFAFLAHGISEDATPPHREQSVQPDSDEHVIFLSLLSWANEPDKAYFYGIKDYRTLHQALETVGVMRTLQLELL